MRRRWPLTPRGTGALILAIACFAMANELGLVELVYFGVLLLAVLLAAFASLYLVRRGETVTRLLHPDVPAVGQDASVVVRVAMRTALPTAPGAWRDTLPPGVAGTARGTFPAMSSGFRGADRSVELHYALEAVGRGIHWIGPLQVSSSDPFGLARRSSLVGDRTRVVVAPAVVDLPPLAGGGGESGGTLQSTTTQMGQGSDNLIARPYASGDSMRRIHWRATAHRDELMVRQEEQESTPEATVVFDRGASRWSTDAAGRPGTDDHFEAGLSAAVSALAHLVHEGYSAQLIDSDGTPLSERIDGGDASGVADVRTSLATLVARSGDHLAEVTQLFGGVTTGPLVVVTGRLHAADAAALAAVPHHSALPILLTALPGDDALDSAAATGWHAVRIGPRIELADAWAEASERGVSNVYG